MANFLLGGELFSVKRPVPDVIQGVSVSVNKSGPRGIALSEFGTDRNRNAKISNVLITALKLMDGSLNCKAISFPCKSTSFPDNLYMEIKEESVVHANGSFFVSNLSDWTDTQKDMDTRIAVGIAYLLALGKESPTCSEFKKVYEKINEQMATTGKCSFNDCLLLCDSFYYSLKSSFAYERGIKMPLNAEELNDESLRQFNRSLRGVPHERINFGYGADAGEFKHFAVEETVAATSTSAMSYIDECRAGKFALPVEWGEKERRNIPDRSFLDLFVPSSEFEEAQSIIYYHLNKVIERMDMGLTGKDAICNNYANIILTGMPGTGKSTIAEAVAASLQLPYYTVPITKNGEEDSFQGMTKLGRDADGGFKFCETPFLNAYKNGGIVVLEEFNMANPGMLMGVLGQAIEKPFVLFEDGYKPVQRHPLCVIIMTCNSMTQGAQEPNEALVSRAPYVYDIQNPSDSEFINILKNRTEDVDDKNISKVYKAYKGVVEYLNKNGDDDVAISVTLRHCIAAIEQIAAGVPFIRAVKNSMINVISLKDPDLAAEIFDCVVEPMI